MPVFTPPLNRIVRICITTVAVGRTFPQKAERLRKSLQRFDPRIPFVPFVNVYPKGTPDQTRGVTYAFKPLAIQQRLDEGYDIVMWIDSAFVAQKSVMPIVAIARRAGHVVLQDDGWNMRQWSSDAQLAAFGITRTAAEHIPIPLAGVCAFVRGTRLLSEWVAKIAMFPGPRRAAHRLDPVFRGTRHDQTILGLLMHRRALKYTTQLGLVSMTETPPQHLGLLHHHPTWTT